MKMNNLEMTAEDVLEIINLLNQNKIEVVIDGGWGVDALLGEQTRPHEDLDVAVEHKDVPMIRELFAELGYEEVIRDDSWECNFVLGDDRNRLIDFHSCTFDSTGNNIFGVEYPLDSLQGTGFINGVQVRCITPEWMVKFHTGYELDENDFRDVRLLCQRFSIVIPDEYHKFIMGDDIQRS